MEEINSVHVLVLVIIVFFLIGLIAIASSKRQQSFLDRFTNKIPVISGFFIAIGLFVTYKVFKLNSDHIVRENTIKLIDRGWIRLNEKLTEYYSQCPSFIDSLYYDWQKKSLLNIPDNMVLPQQTNISNQDKWTCVNTICVYIFQSVEDFITIHTSGSGEHTSDIVWIDNFLHFFKSERVQNIWTHFKSNYDAKTIKLIDYLVEISSTRTPKNEHELQSIANDIISSERYKSIMYS